MGKPRQSKSRKHARGATAAGQATAARIVVAARKVLLDAGCADFSMRTVAERAGVHLANVQYYFPTRADLARALMTDTGNRYRERFRRILASAPPGRVAQFDAALDAVITDAVRPRVRRYFINLWAMLLTLDDGRGRFIDELYGIAVDQHSALIAAYDPSASPEECRRRATVMISLVEGLVIAHGAHGVGPTELKGVLRIAKDAGHRIAAGALSNGRTIERARSRRR